jgi:hypothetical protein
MSAHKPELDDLTPAETRVVCEQLLYTMDSVQRVRLRRMYPGLYAKIEPVHGKLDSEQELGSEQAEYEVKKLTQQGELE